MLLQQLRRLADDRCDIAGYAGAAMSKKKQKLKLDEIGNWSEIKLDIIREYAKAYSTILAAQERPPLHHVYIDAFAGAGFHVSKTTREQVDGSPIIAVKTQPPFKEYHFIELDGPRVGNLQSIFGQRTDIHIHHGDCNAVMLKEVLPKVRYQDYRRGLCLLDPYGLHLNWEVIRTVGEMGTIDMFLNFPIADMNRNVFWRNPDGVAEADIARMTAFWGDESWRTVAYRKELGLYGDIAEKNDNETVAEAFQERLQKSPNSVKVPAPVPMKNNKGAVVYYLFFASKKPVAGSIVTDIFQKYRNQGAI
jgi:three-Cys-motif partner protein